MSVGLHAKRLSVAFAGKPVLVDLSLAFAPGQVTAIVGPNGAGKSTLLSCLAGLRKPNTGAALLGERPLLTIPPRDRAQRLAFLEQTPEVAWAIDVRTLVGLGRTPFTGARGLAAEDRAAVDDALARTGMITFADRIVTSLSGGERARALIARALAGSPDWLLADEPLTGLDIGHQLDALDLFRGLAGEGRGVILTLHDLAAAARAADRIVVLAGGRILADGSAASALSSAVLREAYDVDARLVAGSAGPVIEVTGRVPR